jgi:hypothetical protein
MLEREPQAVQIMGLYITHVPDEQNHVLQHPNTWCIGQ